MADETSTEETKEETKASEETKEELAGEDTPEEKTELDSAKEALAESQEKLKRYKEQVSGSQDEAEKLKTEVEELKAKIPPKEKLQPPKLSAQDQAYQNYLKKLGMFTKTEVEKMVQDRIAPFQAKDEARGKSEQKKILDKFIKSKPDLVKDKDPEGSRMQKVIGRLKRITPADPFNPNASLEEDLELAYNWAFGKEINQEALSKAKAAGRAEGHEAAEAKVGEGASAPSTPSKKTRTPDQEALLKEWGVDDESINKTEKK